MGSKNSFEETNRVCRELYFHRTHYNLCFKLCKKKVLKVFDTATHSEHFRTFKNLPLEDL